MFDYLAHIEDNGYKDARNYLWFNVKHIKPVYFLIFYLLIFSTCFSDPGI